LKITRVTHYVVNVPETRWWWSDDVYGQPEHRRADRGVAEVETDAGIIGLTETNRGTTDAVLEEACTAWVSADVLAVNLARPFSSLPAVFEQAVLDIRGQALGVPIWQLLGGRVRDVVAAAQVTGYKTPENTAEDAIRGWELGFRTYKMKCITSETTPEDRIAYVVDRVEAIHRVLPDMAVRPDIRWRLEQTWVAQELARRLEGHKIDCLESPIARRTTANYPEWRRLRESIAIPIGDHVNAPDLLTVVREGAVDYAIVKGVGALDTVRESYLAHELGLGGWTQTTAYGPAAALAIHVGACMPHLTQPHDLSGAMVWEDTLVNEAFPFADGAFAVPDRPGLGYTLNHNAVNRYLVRKKVFE